MKLFQFVFLVSNLIIWKTVCNGNECKTPQFIEIGAVGVIRCSFRDDISGALWYKLTTHLHGNAFLTLANSEKSGEGYLSGEFDIFPNGSLIIQNVSIKHEGTYKVTILETTASDPKTYFVNVSVFAPTFSRVPVIDNCDNKSEICFQILNSNSHLSCTIRDARPAIPLRLMIRTGEGDLNISSRLFIENETYPFFTSRVTTTNALVYTRALTLLACEAYCPLGFLEKNESLVLIQGSDDTLPNVLPKVVYAKQDTRVKLNCSGMTISYLVWQVKKPSEVIFKGLLHAVFVGHNLHHRYDEEYEFQNTSIVIDNVRVHHEGTYRCISGNGFQDDVIMYELIVFVYPDPPYPVVNGCNHQQYCVLEGHPEGTLTCTIKDIRPQVDLALMEAFGRTSNALQFYEKTITIKDHGDTSDVLLTSKYRCNSVTESRLTVECKVVGTNIEELHLSTKFDLLFLHDQQPYPSTSKRHLLWIIMTTIPICLLAAAVLVLFTLRVRRREKRKRMGRRLHQGEDTAMTSRMLGQQEDPQTDLKSDFIRQLKTKYKYQYDAVQPIPYIRDRLYCVDRVFVEGGFEKLISKTTIEGLGHWEKMASYHVVTNLSSSSTRTIIEGDPGYGKSTLTLQLAYDWCNCNVTSPLADVDILILLRLRQLGGVHSVFRAIKQFILPRDSQLSEKEIQNILQQSKSTVFILDGFDEYPEEEVEDINDIINTIRGEMFQENFVILTSRSFFLPKSYPPQTHRIRLTGFDSNARDAYIRKAVVGDDKKSAEKIKRSLQKNSVLQGLCQVPLFFVMFAHMTHESENFLRFKSVTSFFRYMITCFHSHMKNKMNDRNVKKIDLHENNHASLDKVAFEGLSGKNQQIVWKKEDLIKRLGSEFYIQYRSIGILVEEEILDITDRSGDIQYKTDVRFYHKLFCEWYAAHYLCREVVKHDTNLPKLLEYMNPFDLQYTYRFACGLNADAGNKIIEYLRGIKDGDKFAVLCILEQSGNFDQIKETVQDLCSNYITIDNTDSLLLQASIVQLLEIGSSNQIPVSFVWLKECFNSVDLSAGSILLKSELSIPALSTLTELVIGDRGRKFTNEELSNVITYSTMCSGLKSLRFCYLLMPQSIKKTLCSSLQTRQIQVFWCTDEGDFLLSHQSGKWEAYDTRSSKNLFEGNILAKKNLLKTLMKRKYKELTSAVQVIPSDSENLLPVNEFFVNCQLQCMVTKDKGKSNQQWEPMDSYLAIFTDSPSQCKRFVLEGKPGYGKSMLALRMSYDWCESITQSPLSGFDLFLLVQFTPGNISKSIYTELKRCVLPRDSPLSDIDIRPVLRECTSAVMVLDGLDFYAYEQIDEKCDVRQIIRGKMFKGIDVITTCSFLPEDCAPGTNRIQIMGFDNEARDEYIRKVKLVDEEIGGEKIKQKLRDNPVLKDFINVPLFFTMFAQMSNESKDFCESKTYESSFTWLIECLHSHMKNQGNGYKEDEHFTIENTYLGEVAFSSGRPFVLERDNICKVLGKERYGKYLRLGIFLEGDIVKESEKVKSKLHRHQRGVTFYHELLGIWFAAHYIAKHATGVTSEQIKTVLTRLSKANLQLLCNFVGELNVDAVGSILRLVKDRNDYAELSKLIIYEYIDDASSIEDIVKEVCATKFQFNNNEDEVLQTSMIHLLEIASKAKISISRVNLYNCYSTVDLRGGNHLQLKSNLSIPVLTTLNKLWIDTENEGREITSEEFTGILQYSSKCLALKELWFIYCLLPPSIQAESVSVLRSRNVKVIWVAPSHTWYQLNLQSCLWERIDKASRRVTGMLTDYDYQNEVKHIKQIQERRRGNEAS